MYPVGQAQPFAQSHELGTQRIICITGYGEFVPVRPLDEELGGPQQDLVRLRSTHVADSPDEDSIVGDAQLLAERAVAARLKAARIDPVRDYDAARGGQP
jgi:hypothetical protein